MAVKKTTTFTESNININNNTSSLSIKIYFSANNTVTWFETAKLTCKCNGVTKSKNVSHAKGGSVSATFTFDNIAHNSDGSKSVSWSWSCPTGTSVLGTISDSGTKALTKINRQANLTSAPNFNDEQNPTINYSNPAGNSVNTLMACIASSDGSKIYAAYRNVTKTASSYTFNLTETERNALRSACSNATSMSVRFYLKTNIGGTDYRSYLTKTLSIINATPTFNDFEYEDTNAATRNITNSSQDIVLGFSTLQLTIAGNNKAIPNKKASIKYYLINNKQYTYADSVVVSLEKWNSNTIEITAVDSRGLSKKVTKTLNVANYTALQKGNISLTRAGNINEATTLKYNGGMTRTLPNGSTNPLSVSYKFKKTTESTYTTGTTDITPTIDNDGNFDFEDLIVGDLATGFDINHSYNIVIEASDVLTAIEYTYILNSGIPAIAIKGNNIALHGMYDEENEANIQLNGKVSLNGEIILEDTGWVDLVLQNGITARANNDMYKPAIRRIGNIVFVKGQVTIPAHTSNIVLANIPEDFRPIYEVRFTKLDTVQGWLGPENGNVIIPANNTQKQYQSIEASWLLD